MGIYKQKIFKNLQKKIKQSFYYKQKFSKNPIFQSF